MNTKAKLRYFEAQVPKPPVANVKTAAHSEFLRTGRISRHKNDWLPDEKRYLTYAEVAARTEKKLTSAGEKTHERINGFHKSIRFPKVLFSRSLEERPHLGYCHVTSARTVFGKTLPIDWSFYICNFVSEIGVEEDFFQHIRTDYGRMYFAVAIEAEEEGGTRINRKVRGNGLLFRTSDPNEALRNVLMLGARDDTLRDIIKTL